MNNGPSSASLRANQLDVLRHLAAVLVLWTHSFSLSKDHADPFQGTLLNGSTGVNIFFAISGYLIAESWFRNSDLVAFVEARFLRIMPALVVSVLVSAFLVGPLLSTLPLAEYLRGWQLRWFVLGNSSLLWMVEELPGVFARNPHPWVVNGSLWTLPKEATMYGFVLVVGVLSRMWGGKPLFFLSCLALYVIATLRFEQLGQTEFRFWVFVILVLLVLLAATGRASAWLTPLTLVYGALWLSFSPALKAISGRGRVDISYGLYIYGYFVQQVTFTLFPDMSGYRAFVLSLLLTSGVALLSWMYIEKPAMNLRGRARRFLVSEY